MFDWSKGRFDEVYDKSIPIAAQIADHMRWSKANGRDINTLDYIPVTQNRDISKSMVDNEKEERRKKWEDASEQLGYLLTNLGNFIGAGLGAPEPTNAPDSTKLTERQQRLNEKTENLRRAYSKDFYQAVTKQQAEDRARELALANIDLKRIQGNAAQQKADDNTRITDSRIAYYNAQTGKIEMLTPAQLKKIEADTERSRKQGNAAVQNANANSYNAATRRMTERRQQRGTTRTTNDGRRTKTVTTTPATTGNNRTERVKVDY